MSSIYEIKGEYLMMLDLLDDPEADQESILEALDSIKDELHEKAEQYAYVIKTLETKADAYEQEEKRCAKHKQAIRNNIKTMKTRLKEAMELAEDTKFEQGLFKFNVRNNAPSLDCSDEAALMNELQNLGRDDLIKVERSVKRTDVLNALKAGKLELDYAGIKQTRSLTIK